MKKLLLIIFCLTHYIIHTNDITEAIRKHDLETVTQLLQQQQPSPAQYAKYARIAEEALLFSRERLFMQRLKPAADTKYLPLAVGSLGLFIWSFYYFAIHDNPYFMPPSLILFFGTTVVGICSAHKLLTQEYNNALKIYDLMLDI